jgi:hypothetical protein
MNHKRIAQAFNSTGSLWIERIGDDEFLVSDLVIMIKLNAEGYRTFAEKWGGYSRRLQLPTLMIGDAILYDEEENEYKETSKVIDLPLNTGTKAELTDLSFKGKPLFVSNRKFGCINPDYLKIFDNVEFGYFANIGALTIVKGDEIIGLIKPYKLFDKQSSEIINNIKKFEEILNIT